MGFLTKLPKTGRGNNMIWVIVDRLTKSAHFLTTKEHERLENLAKMYVVEIVVWSTIIYYFWSRDSGCFKILAEASGGIGYKSAFEHSLSSSDWWADWESHTNFIRYIRGLCYWVWWELRHSWMKLGNTCYMLSDWKVYLIICHDILLCILVYITIINYAMD